MRTKKKREPKYNFDQSETCFKLFKESITSPDTQYVWTNCLHNFMVSQGMEKYSDLLEGNPKLTQARLKDYIISKKGKVRAQSIGSQLTGIRHFYWINEYEGIDWERVRAFLPDDMFAPIWEGLDQWPYVQTRVLETLKFKPKRVRSQENLQLNISHQCF